MKSKIGKKNNKNGFTLVEVLIAMFIFSIVATVVLGAYFDVFQSKRKTRAVQQDIEDARYAMELMAKTIRMSSVFGGGANSIEVYDYSQGICLKYFLDGSGILMAQEGVGHDNPGDKGSWIDGCDTGSYGSSKPMTTAKVHSLQFDATKSDVGSKKLGHVTMSYKICYEDDCNLDSATIQTSVSLRDYNYINNAH